jgi:hypothetical protein
LLRGLLNSHRPGLIRDVAALVLNAIREDELYVFTHHDGSWRGEIEARFAAILAALDKAAAR